MSVDVSRRKLSSPRNPAGPPIAELLCRTSLGSYLCRRPGVTLSAFSMVWNDSTYID